MAPTEGSDDREEVQAGRIADPAAVQQRRGRDRGVDQREAADCHRRVLQRPHQHPGRERQRRPLETESRSPARNTAVLNAEALLLCAVLPPVSEKNDLFLTPCCTEAASLHGLTCLAGTLSGGCVATDILKH